MFVKVSQEDFLTHIRRYKITTKAVVNGYHYMSDGVTVGKRMYREGKKAYNRYYIVQGVTNQ